MLGNLLKRLGFLDETPVETYEQRVCDEIARLANAIDDETTKVRFVDEQTKLWNKIMNEQVYVFYRDISSFYARLKSSQHIDVMQSVSSTLHCKES